MLLGMLWAAFAPVLLLVPIVWLTVALRKREIRRAPAVAVAVVLVPVGALWLYGDTEFRSVCDDQGRPTISQRAFADGVLLNSGTSNSFGMRYLQDEGFSWFEARSIYKRDGWVRYSKDADGKISTVDIDAPTARFEVREVFSAPFDHTHLSQTQVIDRQTGTVLSQAGSANYDGGWSKLVLGAWGMRSCPSAMFASEDFGRYYHLARDTLRSK